MKNKTLTFYIIVVFLFLKTTIVFSEDLNITADTISIDKNSKFAIFKRNVVAKDLDNNTLETNLATYDKVADVLLATESTKIITSENYSDICRVHCRNEERIILAYK